jgi:hypothetical protein
MSSSKALTASDTGSVSNTCDLCDLHLHDSSGSFRVLPTPPRTSNPVHFTGVQT